MSVSYCAKIPVLYHPTNVMFVDDDNRFLNNICLSLDLEFPYIAEPNPCEALDYLKNHVLNKEETPVFSDMADPFDTRKYLEHISFNYFRVGRDILKLNHSRYKKIIVAVVDKTMPEMDGIEFCEKIRSLNLPIKIILLTGTYKTSEAIGALNDGLIDCYLSKSEDNVLVELGKAVTKLSHRFFQEISEKQIYSKPFLKHRISKPTLVHKYLEILNKHNIIESYVIDYTGSMLLIDKTGSSKLLLLRDELDFEKLIKIASNKGAPDEVIRMLSLKKKIPFCNHENIKLNSEGWQKLMQPVQPVEDSHSSLYYSLLDIKDTDIMSFDKYVNEIWPEA